MTVDGVQTNHYQTENKAINKLQHHHKLLSQILCQKSTDKTSKHICLVHQKHEKLTIKKTIKSQICITD